jgi:hypothetical protein
MRGKKREERTGSSTQSIQATKGFTEGSNDMTSPAPNSNPYQALHLDAQLLQLRVLLVQDALVLLSGVASLVELHLAGSQGLLSLHVCTLPIRNLLLRGLGRGGAGVE